MFLGCKHDYIIQYHVALREPAIGAGMETPYIPRDQEDRGIWNFSKHCTLAGIRNHVNFHHAYFWRQAAHSVLSPPPPQPQTRIKYKFEGKKIEISRFV